MNAINTYAAIALFGMFGVAGFNVVPWGKFGVAEVAYWVQALGSIAAIGAGAYFIHYQAFLARKNRRRAVLAIVELAVRAVTQFGEIDADDAAALAQFQTLNDHRIQYAYRSLCAIPLHDIDSTKVIMLIDEAIEILRGMSARLTSTPVVPIHLVGVMGINANLYRSEVARLLEIRSGVALEV
ncbi:hypothetical protein [Pandoraea sp. B-6]|uniref:hypothetical protein n=1 Tax=Pandoraea sp. B-6 TaxID=1204340 RepID=UPI0012F94764|nr:hypothetical protein [Pandoraea sp. B-6]